VGGVISAMIMSLLVLRVLYSVFAGVSGDAMAESDSRSETPDENHGQLPIDRPRDSLVSTVD
jgi:cobalt-zinc-cadmium resistance protein CzcA